MKNIIRWILCVLSIIVVIFCFFSIINSVLLAGNNDTASPDRSAALSTMFTSIAILLTMVGVFVVCLIKNLENDEGKLTLPTLCIGGVTAICMLLALVFAFGDISNQAKTISDAESHQRLIESLNNTNLVSKLEEENLIITINIIEQEDPLSWPTTKKQKIVLGIDDAKFVELINSEILLNETNHENFVDSLKTMGLYQELGWKEEIWFKTQRTELATTIFVLIVNLLIFGTFPLLYGWYSLIKKNEEFQIVKKANRL